MSRSSYSRFAIAFLLSICVYIAYNSSWNSAQLKVQEGSFNNGSGKKAVPSESKDAKIVMIMFNNKETSYDILSLSNKSLYAKKHGYDLEMRFDGTNGGWYKLNMIEDAINLNKYDWIWWLDFDTLITNTTVRLTDIIENTLHSRPDRDNIDLILTPDCWPMNTGSMLIRSTQRVHSFLALVRECGESVSSEQDCFRDVVGADTSASADRKFHSGEWAAKTIIIPQKTVNAFPEEIKCHEHASEANPGGLWQPGDFVIHFAGAWAHLPKENDPTGYLMEKYREFAGGD